MNLRDLAVNMLKLVRKDEQGFMVVQPLDHLKQLGFHFKTLPVYDYDPTILDILFADGSAFRMADPAQTTRCAYWENL